MKISVERYLSDGAAILSKVYLDEVFECYGWESRQSEADKLAARWVAEGTYPVTLCDDVPVHPRYKDNFPGIHKGMLCHTDGDNEITAVIFMGDDMSDQTPGLVIGTTPQEKPGALSLWSPRNAYLKFYLKTVAAAETGDLSIEYIDKDQRADPLVASREAM